MAKSLTQCQIRPFSYCLTRLDFFKKRTWRENEHFRHFWLSTTWDRHFEHSFGARTRNWLARVDNTKMKKGVEFNTKSDISVLNECFDLQHELFDHQIVKFDWILRHFVRPTWWLRKTNPKILIVCAWSTNWYLVKSQNVGQRLHFKSCGDQKWNSGGKNLQIPTL